MMDLGGKDDEEAFVTKVTRHSRVNKIKQRVGNPVISSPRIDASDLIGSRDLFVTVSQSRSRR